MAYHGEYRVAWLDVRYYMYVGYYQILAERLYGMQMFHSLYLQLQLIYRRPL